MPASRSNRRAALVSLLVGALLAASIPEARAQPSEDISLELISQPAWHGRDDPLALRLKITNGGLSTLQGFGLQVRGYSPAISRSDLHENFEVDPFRIESSSLSRIERLDQDVPAGTSTTVDIDQAVSGLTSIAGGPAGVYPVTITLTDALSTGLDSVTTQLLYFPDEVEAPLNVVVMWPLADIPSRRAGGVFTTDDDGVVPLEEAVGPEGWLSGILDSLEASSAKELRVGLAPGPRLIEEIADMSDGFRRDDGSDVRAVVATNPAAQAARTALERMRTYVSRKRTQTIQMPYALADLTAIDDFERLSAQLNASGSVLDEELGVTPDGWLFAPAGRLDEVTLERLRSSEAASSTIFSADSLEPEALDAISTCRQDFVGISYTCPIKVTTPSGSSRGFVLDPELQQRFGALVSAPGNVAEMQKFLAELAMIYFELPGTTERVIAISVPPLWHPPPGIAARFVRSLTQGPWIRSRTPRAGLHLGIGTIERDLVTAALPPRGAPDQTYLDAVDDAAAVIESFARIRPPVALVQRLRRDALMGQSLLWWGEDPERLTLGASFAQSAQREAEDQFEKISIVGRPDITLASRRGTLPLSLQNSTDYPVTLEVHLDSTDRDLELSERVLNQTFEPGTTALAVQVSSQASGIYPVSIRVMAADGYEVVETTIRVRSTEFNEIALGITLGAFLFLVAFTLIRSIRKRRAPVPESSE
jgi:hypothetical protein